MSLTESTSCDLVFYTNPMSRGQIVRWMLEEIDQPYRQVLLDYGAAMKAPEYLAINPMGKVPALCHGERVITECAAICAYLADAFPESGLAPDPHDRASYYRWLFFAAGPLEAAITNHQLKFEVSDEQQRMAGYGNYNLTMDMLQAATVSASPYIAGEQFSAADVYLGSHLIWGLEFGAVPHRAEFEDYTARLTERPAYRAAKAIDAQ